MAINDAYKIPITERMTTKFECALNASGNKGINHLITPYKPILTITALNTIVTAVGDCSYASGCHVCKGKMGILIAKAVKNKANAVNCCPALKPASLKDCIAKL